MDKIEFVSTLSKLRPSSTFLTLHKYCNSHGEVADFNIIFHMSYRNALERSLMALEPIIPASDLEAQAKLELINSFKNSLLKIETTPIDEIDDAYTRFVDENGEYIKGVKLHTESDTLHLYGLVVHKKVHVPGVYKKVNHKPLTIAKDKLRKFCPVEKFRQFKLQPIQVDSISVEKLSLLPPEQD